MKCPTCGQPVKWEDNPHRPFCSERCKLIDFGRWANEEYSVPGETFSTDREAAEDPSKEEQALNDE